LKPAYLAVVLIALALPACSSGTPAAPGASPAPTAVSQPVGAPTATAAAGASPTGAATAPPAAEPTATAPAAASLDPRALDTAGMEECALLADSDFSAVLGQSPANPVPEAEVNRAACYYTFSGGQMVAVTIITGQPGRQVYDGNLQYPDFAAGSEPLTLGEIAIVKEDGDRVTIYAVINGWYVEVNGRGFERQAMINLARLFEPRLITYYPPPDAAPTATPAAQGAPSPSGGACQNEYYPVVQGASWQYRLSGVSNDTFTRAIAVVRADGFDDQDTFGAGTTRKGSWACQDGNLIALTPSSGATVSAAEMQADFTIESNSGISFPANPQPGQTWTQNIVYLGQQITGGATIQSRNVLETSCTAGNVEKVTVPAGEFQALRVDCTTRLDIYISGTLVFTLNSSNAAWHAPKVGVVKSSGSSNMGATDIVLLAYSIP
jgi:hypothetical protein